MNEKLANKVKVSSQDLFKNVPLLTKAPGRINLIGEHTDYNFGFVLPAAINKDIYFAVTISDSSESTLVSLDKEQTFRFQVGKLTPTKEMFWANYIMGVVSELQKAGYQVPNFNAVFAGDLPQGSGMSSSAALECGVCFALNELFDLGLNKKEMALICQKAEHSYVGVDCGIMDQFSSLMGQSNYAIHLDCQSLDFQYVPINFNEYSILLCNSNVVHSLASSEYNQRRTECLQGVQYLQNRFPEVRSLRGVSMEQLLEVKEDMPEVIFRRCKYIIDENDRVLKFADALQNDRFELAGEILKNAQYGMKHEYEITCKEIDYLAELANSSVGVLGSRMMGGGFGGCTINLIEKGAQEDFVNKISHAYRKKFGLELTSTVVEITNGVSLIS